MLLTNFKGTVPKSDITWCEWGKQNVQANKVYFHCTFVPSRLSVPAISSQSRVKIVRSYRLNRSVIRWEGRKKIEGAGTLGELRRI